MFLSALPFSQSSSTSLLIAGTHYAARTPECFERRRSHHISVQPTDLSDELKRSRCGKILPDMLVKLFRVLERISPQKENLSSLSKAVEKHDEDSKDELVISENVPRITQRETQLKNICIQIRPKYEAPSLWA